MDGDNRTPDKTIGEVKYAEVQTERTTGHLPPHGAGAGRDKDDAADKAARDPGKK